MEHTLSENTLSENTLSENSIRLLETVFSMQPSNNKEKSKYASKQSLLIGENKHVSEISNYKARKVSNKTKKQAVQRSLEIVKHTAMQRVVCPDTGIVSLLEIPAIPGYALTYEHPLSDLNNCRGLAQQGKDYLRKLEPQILAGIAIVIAADYSLFVYQPADSGAQKNAVLRTVQKDTLINAILMIEDMIHSGNHFYLPRLSLIMDTEVSQGGIETRMQSWLKLVVEAIYKPDTEVWDENETAQRNNKLREREANKERLAEESLLRSEQKRLKDDLKAALALIKEMYKEEQILGKMRSFLGGVFQEFQLLTMEEGARFLLTSKLEAIGSAKALKLSEILNKERKGLVARNSPMEDFFAETEAPAVRVKAATENAPEVIFTSVEIVLKEVPEGFKRINLNGKNYIVVAQEYDNMSFIERIKYNKFLLATMKSEELKAEGETK